MNNIVDLIRPGFPGTSKVCIWPFSVYQRRGSFGSIFASSNRPKSDDERVPVHPTPISSFLLQQAGRRLLGLGSCIKRALLAHGRLNQRHGKGLLCSRE
jgi:hypothetical protein